MDVQRLVSPIARSEHSPVLHLKLGMRTRGRFRLNSEHTLSMSSHWTSLALFESHFFVWLHAMHNLTDLSWSCSFKCITV